VSRRLSAGRNDAASKLEQQLLGGSRSLPRPDRFDPTRKNIAYLPLPDLHLDPTAPAPRIKGVAFRSPAALPVEFTAA
jgi:hypothetical protein